MDKLSLYPLLCLLLHLTKPLFVNSNTVPTLISTMLRDSFLESCEIIFVNLQAADTDKSTTEILSSSIELPYEDTWGSSGVFSVIRSTSNLAKIPKFRRLEDIHRFNSRHCGVALVFVSHITPNLSKWLFDTITPPYVPIIRKDEDPFIFVFKNGKDTSEMLFSKQFGNKIRFKIAIQAPPVDNITVKPVIQTVYLYQNSGQPMMKPAQLGESGMIALFPDSTRNFNGRQIRVASPKAPSHFEMAPLPNGHGFRSVRGIYKVWLDVMMERFNFTVTLTLSSYYGGTGKKHKNGTWLGAVGDVLYDRADMASFNGHIYNRHTVVEWSAPVTYEWMAFVTHKPMSFFSASAIFKPFPIILWVGFLVSVVIICLVIKLFLQFNPGIKYENSYRKTIMYLTATFVEQDANYYLYILHLSTVRVIVVFWLLFAMILSTAYRGKLVSLIAFPALTWVPTNFEELAHSRYRVGLNTLGRGGAVYSVLSTSNNPVYKKIFSRLEIYPDSAKCLREALENDFGCIMVQSIGEVVAYKNFTDKFGRSPFEESDQMTLFHADGYIWEKKAVFRQNFDRVTWSIMESGLHGLWFQNDLDSLKQKRLAWERETGNRTTIVGPRLGPSKLKVAHLMGLFYLFLSGLVVSFFYLLWEKFPPSQHRLQLDNLLCLCRKEDVIQFDMRLGSAPILTLKSINDTVIKQQVMSRHEE